jgi:hypothetical protein
VVRGVQILVRGQATPGTPDVRPRHCPALPHAAGSRSYEQIRIHASGSSRLLSLGHYRYHVVRRLDLCSVVGEMLDACPGFQVRQGAWRGQRTTATTLMSRSTARRSELTGYLTA